jgi:hypothetical protein
MRTKAVRTAASSNPMIWRIAVTGITIAITALVPADAVPGGRSITASFASSLWQ